MKILIVLALATVAHAEPEASGIIGVQQGIPLGLGYGYGGYGLGLGYGGLALGGLHGGIWKREAESDPEADADASFNYAGNVGASAIGLGYGYAGLGNLGFLRTGYGGYGYGLRKREADAELRYSSGYWGRGYYGGYGSGFGYGRILRPYGNHKRSADAEPEADASLYGGFSGAGYYGLGLSGGCFSCGGFRSSYGAIEVRGQFLESLGLGGGEWRPWYLRGGGHGIGKREAEPEADASLGYGLGGIIGVQQGIPLAAAPIATVAAAPVATIAAAPVVTTRTVAVAAPAITTTTLGGGLLAGGLGLAGAHPW